MSLKAPLAAQLFHQRRVGAAGFAVRAVVCAHHALHSGLAHERAEGGQIGLLHVLRADLGVEAVAQRLRPAVGREVLGAGGGFERLPFSLKASHEGDAQTGGQIRVFSVGFVPASPAGIAEDVHVGRPHRQPVVDIPVPLGREGVVLGSGLRCDRRGDLLQQLLVEHGRHADRLREARGRAGAGQPVQGFVPPVVSRDAQALDRRRVKAELRGHLLDRHAADELLRFSFCLFSRHGQRSFPAQS